MQKTSKMKEKLVAHVNSTSAVNERPRTGLGDKCIGGSKQRQLWPNWSVMALRVFAIICLLMLADAQKWPVVGNCNPCECYYKTNSFGRMRTMNCSRRGLSVIPQNFPPDVMALDLSWNQLSVSQLKGICQLKSLQSLSLSYNELTNLSAILTGCTSLLELNLTGNQLIEISVETFRSLDNLRRLLGLEVTSITSRNVFRQLTNLKDLDLIFHGDSLPKGIFDDMVVQSLNLVLTKSTSLPKGVFEFGQKTLNTLQLIGEQVTELSDDLLDGLCVLRRLFLTMPSVAQLPERFFHSQQQSQQKDTLQAVEPMRPASLQEVEISGIGSLPPRLFNQLINLETLTLKSISSFPQIGFLTEVVNLQMLVIEGGTLPMVPASWFKQLYSLKHLKLSGMQLESLHENAFEGLLTLNYLDLSNNRLQQITGQMLQPVSQNLQTLIVSSNQLTGIHQGLLSNLRSLRYLDISDNQLAQFGAGALYGMTYLKIVYLNSNRLTSLPTDLFKDQLQVEALSISDNYLSEFPTTILQLSSSLVNLDLSYNELETLPAAELCQFTYLETVNINGNRLHCDCTLLGFQRCSQLLVDGQCSSPPAFKDKDLSEVQVPSSCVYNQPQLPNIPKQPATTPGLNTKPAGRNQPRDPDWELTTNVLQNGGKTHSESKWTDSIWITTTQTEEFIMATISASTNSAFSIKSINVQSADNAKNSERELSESAFITEDKGTQTGHENAEEKAFQTEHDPILLKADGNKSEMANQNSASAVQTTTLLPDQINMPSSRASPSYIENAAHGTNTDSYGLQTGEKDKELQESGTTVDQNLSTTSNTDNAGEGNSWTENLVTLSTGSIKDVEITSMSQFEKSRSTAETDQESYRDEDKMVQSTVGQVLTTTRSGEENVKDYGYVAGSDEDYMYTMEQSTASQTLPSSGEEHVQDYAENKTEGRNGLLDGSMFTTDATRADKKSLKMDGYEHSRQDQKTDAAELKEASGTIKDDTGDSVKYDDDSIEKGVSTEEEPLSFDQGLQANASNKLEGSRDFVQGGNNDGSSGEGVATNTGGEKSEQTIKKEPEQKNAPNDKTNFIETSDGLDSSNPKNEEALGNATNSGISKDPIAFNFIISSLSAVALFLLGLLLVCCLRFYQRRGSYDVARDDADLERMDSGMFDLKMVQDAAAVLGPEAELSPSKEQVDK